MIFSYLYAAKFKHELSGTLKKYEEGICCDDYETAKWYVFLDFSFFVAGRDRGGMMKRKVYAYSNTIHIK